MLRRFIVIAGIFCASMTGYACAPQTRFEWGNYEASLYAYYKSPDERAQYETTLTKAIESGKKSNRVAPGLYAELGYMRMEDSDLAGAKENFENEMQLFPESRPFLTGIIQRMGSATTTAPATPNAKAPTS